jgi:hypothetical protein
LVVFIQRDDPQPARGEMPIGDVVVAFDHVNKRQCTTFPV